MPTTPVKKLCACGCNQEFEATFPNMKVIPEHRYEHRLRLAREAMRRIKEKKKAGGYIVIPRRARKVDSVCPTCRRHHQGEVKWEYCPTHLGNRNQDGGNTAYLGW